MSVQARVLKLSKKVNAIFPDLLLVFNIRLFSLSVSVEINRLFSKKKPTVMLYANIVNSNPEG